MFAEKLHLKEQMDRSYLIQRLLKPVGRFNPFSFGGGLRNGGLSAEAVELLEGIFSFDYMGSAEFEWGAVPTALQFVAEEAGKGQVASGEYRGVYYICPSSYEQGVRKVIGALLDNVRSLRLKEYCGLSDAVNPSAPPRRNPIVGWLELNNGFFMFTDAEMFENTKRLLGVN